jgi:integrase
MAVHKRKYRNGRVVWYYEFSADGSSRTSRERFTESGFPTRKEATDAEAVRRLQVQRDAEEAEKAAAPPPLTLAGLLGEYFADQDRKPEGMRIASKTLERYRELAAYLSPELTALPLTEITPPRLNREWSRLLQAGGHHRKTKEARPLSAKTVRNIAGVVSTAFKRAIFWQVATLNPVTLSEPPVPQKRKGAALTPAQQRLLIEAASGCWCIRPFLELDAATGARRGEVLALRWSDYIGDAIVITRSLAQTKSGLEFKGTKTDEPRRVTLPDSAIASLDAHRKAQHVFREQFGSHYRTDLNLIFANPDGTPLKPDSISASVSALFKRLKIPKPKGAALHLLRHSHGSHLLAQNEALTTVSERLGHSSPRVTADIYSHAITGRDKEAARKWEEFQRQSTERHPHQ